MTEQSKLDIVREALKENLRAIITHYSYAENIPPFHVNHEAVFIVAPKGGLYTLEELQEFMMRLVPNLKPTAAHDFRREYNHLIKSDVIIPGWLCYREKIGQVDAETWTGRTRARDAVRHIYVRPFPDETMAGEHEKYTGYIDLKELERKRPRNSRIRYRQVPGA